MKQAAQSAKILIVDDEPDTVEIVERVLEASGFEIRKASDGDEALAVAYTWKPDVIILDVMMPHQDGWLVCAKLKSIQPSPRVIIFTVLRHGESDRLAGFVHADGIIHKPFTRAQLLEKIKLVLGFDSAPTALQLDR